MLLKLDINPIEIGIILTGAMEDGLVLMADDSDINAEDVRDDLISGLFLSRSILHVKLRTSLLRQCLP